MAGRARVELEKEQPITPHKTWMDKLLDAARHVGNKVPQPAVIFILLTAVLAVLSHLFYSMEAGAIPENVVSGDVIPARLEQSAES